MATRHSTTSVRRTGWLLALAACLAAAAAGFALVRRGSDPSAEGEAAAQATATVAENESNARDQDMDESGSTAAQPFILPVTDPLSLEHIRDCYVGRGYRGVQALTDRLTQGGLDPDAQLRIQIQIALCNVFEGEYLKGSEIMARLRTMVEADPKLRVRALPTVIFLQGALALRQGETENCVECGCDSSCIFPIRPAAFHQKREGSRKAMNFFLEYLRLYPNDYGVRWLLTIAAMTLGEYPNGVPAEYRIPLEPFRSEIDVGRFVDVAALVGVNRLHMAGGAIMDDFDNDGRFDLIETDWDEGGPMKYFHNQGDGTFEDRTKGSGLECQMGGLYCVQTDYNNDGHLDIYVARGGWKGPMRHSLLRNNGNGTFTDVTLEAGLKIPIPSQVACWADYDNDGLLDLFIGGEPSTFRGQKLAGRSALYHNRGDGTFEEVSIKAGVANQPYKCKGANWCDYDGDGYPDLLVSNLDGPCKLFHNNCNGTFTDVTKEMGIGMREGFACWFFDYDNDGWPDIYINPYSRHVEDVIKSHLGLPHHGDTPRLYRNIGGKRFEDVTAAVGLDKAICPMGSNFLDLDNDGFLDIYLGTGNPSLSMLVPNRLFKNVGGKRFTDVTTSSGTGHLQKGHAVACGDWDRDGNVDIFEQLGGAVPGDRFRSVLFQNPGNRGNHWIEVKLVGKKSNRPGIGARIKVTVPGEAPNTFYRHVTSGSSFGANPLQQHIGVGKASKIATLELSWPTSRTTQVFHDVAVDQAIEITEFDKDYRRLEWKRLPAPAIPEPQPGDRAARAGG
jgi:hypothetical protein